MADGMPSAEACRSSLTGLGGAEQMKQAVRDERAGTGVEELWQDVRFGLRQLRRSPGFAVTGAADHRDGSGSDNGNVQRRLRRNPETATFTQPDRLVAVGSKP